jgi:hypothetical protein
MIILSILIPTIPERGKMFTELFNEVHKQVAYMDAFHPSLGQIEVLVDDSKKFLDGGLSIGKKRESLVHRAAGKYLCFLDDDDSIAPNYVETLVRLCQEDKDVCTFKNISKLDNFWMIIDMSLQYDNRQASPGYIINREPWHICPIRSSIAKQFPFLDVNYGEDWEWMQEVLTLCKTEAKTDTVLHQYRHSSKISEADKITTHGLLAK